MTDSELRIYLEFPMVRATFGGEEVRAPFSFDLENNVLLHLVNNLNEYGPTFREHLLIPVGQQLFESLLPPPVLSLYLRARAARLKREGQRLTIRIVSPSEQLLSVPWEFMYDARHGMFPATALETPVVRTLGEVQEGTALQGGKPLRVLAAGACPLEEPELDYDQELVAVQAMAEKSGATVQVIRDATFQQLGNAVNAFRPHILHLVAHGYCDARSCGVRLDDGDGNTHLVSSIRMGDWFNKWTPGLILLNACESGRVQAEVEQRALPVALAQRGIPAIIAMQYPVPDEAAALFARRFYETLFQGLGVEEAVQTGRHALLASNGLIQRHFATPVFYLSRQSGGHLGGVVPRPAKKTVSSPGIRVSPFKYLDAFGQDDKAMFFGRGKAIEEVVTLIATHRLSVVHGVSGVGKTSLLRAGLAQSIAEGLYHVINIRVVPDPIRSLEKAVDARIAQAVEQQTADGTRGDTVSRREVFGGGINFRGPQPPPDPRAPLSERLKYLQSQGPKTVLIIFDQFEETITVLDEPVRIRLLDLLDRLCTDPDLRLRIVLVVREDFLGALGTFTRWLPTILANCYRLEPLSAAGARESIEGPLNLVGCPYEPELVTRLIQDLGGTEVDPASLQIAGHLLFEAAAQSGEGLTLRLYESLNGAQGLMDRHLERLERDLSSAEKNTLYRILQVFVGQYGTRRPVDLTMLTEEVQASEEILRHWIEYLERFRVVRAVDQDNAGNEGDDRDDPANQSWELSHDVLAKAVMRRAELLGFRREVARLTLKTRALGSLTAVLTMVILGIGVTYLGSGYGISYRLVAPHTGTWQYRLVAGQEACVSFADDLGRYEVQGAFKGREHTFWTLPVGTYELTLMERDAADVNTIWLPLKVSAFSLETLFLPPKPIVRFHGHEMVYVPGATVRLGYSKLLVNIVPTDHEKTTTVRPFYIDRFEVTQGQYQAFLHSPEAEEVGARSRLECLDVSKNELKSRLRPDPLTLLPAPGVDPSQVSRLPTVYTRVDEAEAYARWLTRLSGGRYHFRLPTPEEWELATRGVDGREFPWGDCYAYKPWSNLLDSTTEDGFKERAPVGSFPDGHSPYGILDMAGNVSELMRQCAPSSRPGDWGRSQGCTTIVRGANFTRAWFDAIAAKTISVRETLCSSLAGFRLAMDVPENFPD